MISIIIAVKNEISHIKECFESLETQTFKNYEVIFVDAQSNDGTRKFLEKRIEKNENFFLLNNPNGDAASGRNIGIKKAKGDLIAFIDSDAYADKNWLSNIKLSFNQIKNDNIVGVGGPTLAPPKQNFLAKTITEIMSSFLACGGNLNPSTQHKKLDKIRTVSHIPTCNLALKKNIFEKGFLFDERFKKGQDFELSMRLAKENYSFLFNPEIKVYHYRKNSLKSLSRQIFKWGIARGLLIQKNGFNLTYLLPLLAMILFFLFSLLSLYFPSLALIIVSMSGLYILLVLFESLRLFPKKIKSFLFCLIIFPLIHFSYTFGLIKGLLKKL